MAKRHSHRMLIFVALSIFACVSVVWIAFFMTHAGITVADLSTPGQRYLVSSVDYAFGVFGSLQTVQAASCSARAVSLDHVQIEFNQLGSQPIVTVLSFRDNATLTLYEGSAYCNVVIGNNRF